MKHVIWCAVAAVLLCGSDASAQNRASRYSYCAISMGQGMQYEDCHFDSLDACRQELLGLGGYCRPNPRYVPPEPRRSRRRAPPD
jgi:hypothetical protein